MILKRHAGCLPNIGCYGPDGPYYTLFGSELRYLTPYFLLSLFFGLVVLSILYILRRKKKLHLRIGWLIIIPIVVTLILFLLLAFFFPVIIFY